MTHREALGEHQLLDRLGKLLELVNQLAGAVDRSNTRPPPDRDSQSLNQAMQKRPNTLSIVNQAAQAGKSGSSGSMLTSSQGIDLSSLQLARNKLLGA